MSLFWYVLWYVLFIAFIAGAIGAIVHCARRFHPPMWAAILLGIAMFALPFVTFIVYWLVIGVIRMRTGTRSTNGTVAPRYGRSEPAPAPTADA